VIQCRTGTELPFSARVAIGVCDGNVSFDSVGGTIVGAGYVNCDLC